MAQAGFEGEGGCREVQDWFVEGTAPRYGCDVWDRLPGVGAGPRWPWQRWGRGDDEDDD